MSLCTFLYEKDVKLYLDLEDDQDFPPQIMERHYQILSKECQRAKPKWEIVNYYLNKEFLNRRNFVKVTPASVQTKEFLATYPCFKKAGAMCSSFWNTTEFRTYI